MTPQEKKILELEEKYNKLFSEVAKSSAITMDTKLFSTANFVKAFTLFATGAGLYFQLKADIKEMIISERADKTVINSRLLVLEASDKNQSGQMQDFYQFKIQTEAILADETRIKKSR